LAVPPLALVSTELVVMLLVDVFSPVLPAVLSLVELAWIIHEVSSQKSKDALKG
jgi:hypothetical protein